MIKAIIGDGGHAKEVMAQMRCELIRFVDDEYYTKKENVLPISQFDPEKYKVMIAVGDSILREKFLQKLPEKTKFFSFIHYSCIIGDNVKIGEGCFIGAYSILTCDIEIGNHCILNRGNHIGHDCKIGDFLSMMPGSIISGTCNIGNRVYFGTNSSVKEKINICDDVIIGMNSSVLKDIKLPGVFVGIPVTKIK